MMTLQEQLEKALVIMTEAHAGQVDKSNAPYVLHPLTVMQRMATLEEKVVAVLHDVIEDTTVSLFDLAEEGIERRLLESIDTLSRRRKEPYACYIDRIIASGDKIAINVKLQDLLHNADLGRLKEVSDKDRSRAEKYRQAHERLATAKEEWDYENCDHEWVSTGYGRKIDQKYHTVYRCDKCGKREWREGVL